MCNYKDELNAISDFYTENNIEFDIKKIDLTKYNQETIKTIIALHQKAIDKLNDEFKKERNNKIYSDINNYDWEYANEENYRGFFDDDVNTFNKKGKVIVKSDINKIPANIAKNTIYSILEVLFLKSNSERKDFIIVIINALSAAANQIFEKKVSIDDDLEKCLFQKIFYLNHYGYKDGCTISNIQGLPYDTGSDGTCFYVASCNYEKLCKKAQTPQEFTSALDNLVEKNVITCEEIGGIKYYKENTVGGMLVPYYL